ncbi:MAG: hypothetical protein WEF50_10660 [Myxococcota bacterium]
MGEGVILDPSMFLRRQSFGLIQQALERAADELIVPRVLLDLPSNPRGSEVLKFFLPEGEVVQPDEVLRFLADNGGRIVSYDNVDAHPEFSRGLSREVESDVLDGEVRNTVHTMLLQEWQFMTHESWLVGQSRRALGMFIRAGAGGLEMSKTALERVVRRIMRKQPGEPLSRSEYVLASAKFVAFGGPLVATLVAASGASGGTAVPPAVAIANAIVEVGASVFLYFDP